MAATTIMEFTDRVFLANYAVDAIAAAMPAGIAVFLVLTLFTGVTTYLNVFIAQYAGAGKFRQIGSCIWQGIYFSSLSALVLICLSFFSRDIFRIVGHAPEVQALESVYFTILCRGGGIHVLGTALSCFFSGLGRTRPILVINAIGTLINIPLDYALINGVCGFPEMGILGAGIATVSSWSLITLVFAGRVFTPGHQREFRVITAWVPDPELFLRIIRKGGAAALQFSMDVLAFTFFIFMVGRLGKDALAVSNIALSIESIAFLPATGFSMALSTLVGQSLGKNDVPQALSFTRQTLVLLLSYTFIVDVMLLGFPEELLAIFLAAENGSAANAALMEQGVWVLRIMAVFISFDAMYFTFIGALKGAGDTRFIMWSIGGTSLFIMILPLWILIHYTDMGLRACWINLTLYVMALFTVSFLRYRQGQWKTIRVI